MPTNLLLPSTQETDQRQLMTLLQPKPLHKPTEISTNAYIFFSDRHLRASAKPTPYSPTVSDVGSGTGPNLSARHSTKSRQRWLALWLGLRLMNSEEQGIPEQPFK